MSEYVSVLAASELPAGRATEVAVGSHSIALFNVGGRFHALANRCPHRGGPLGQGFLEGTRVSCPWHNYTFDVTTGENVVRSDLKVDRFEVKVEGGQVYVKVE